MQKSVFKMFLVVCSVLTGLVVTGSASAQAVDAQAAPNRCGSGYVLIDQENLNALGPNYGVVYLYYNSSTGYNCVFTEKAVARGTATYVSAFVCRNSDGRCNIDGGNYLYYAKADPLYAKGQCVKWGGGVSNTNGSRDYFESGWEHCGR